MGGNLKTHPGLAKLNHVTGRRRGTRTPFITRWPGRIKPGVSDEVVSTIDLAASLAALTGQTLPTTACPDSNNVLGALLNEPGAKGRNQLLQQGNDGDNLGLRVGDWKLIRMKKKGKTPAIVSIIPPTLPTGTYGLYFLPDDPAERNDVSARHPSELKRLKDLMEKLVADGLTPPRGKSKAK